MKIMNNISKQDRHFPVLSALSWILAITLMIIMITSFTLFSLNECPAHEGEDLEQAKAIVDNRTPFSFTPSKQLGNKYTETPATTPYCYNVFRLSATRNPARMCGSAASR